VNIVIFGATGFSGRAILQKALEANHNVTILVRNRTSVDIRHHNLTIIEGNVLDRTILHQSLHNQEVIIQCLGIGGKGDGKPNTFVSDATSIILEEMKICNVKRIIAMSNVGAGDSKSFLPWYFTKIILPYFMKWLQVIIDDKNTMEQIIMRSDMDWTIVRCPNIIDVPKKGRYTATLDGKNLRLSITLGDMANFMIQQITDSTYSRKAPSISN